MLKYILCVGCGDMAFHENDCPVCWECVETINDVAWVNTEVRAHIRTGKGNEFRLSRDNGPGARRFFKRLRSHNNRRQEREIIKEQLSLYAA
jgi:hypothetical protein